MVHIVVEGQTDQLFIEALLKDLRKKCSFELDVAGGKEAGRPLARKILALQHQPVAFVFDTDSSDRDRSAEQEESLRSYFQMSAPGAPLLLVAMIPSIEALLVEHPEVVEHRLGRKLSLSERVAARFEPRGFLNAHLKHLRVKNIESLFRQLRAHDLDLLRKDKKIEKLRDFVEKHCQQAQAG